MPGKENRKACASHGNITGVSDSNAVSETANPLIDIRLNIPITPMGLNKLLPNTMSRYPRIAAMMDEATSGSSVPTETIVKARIRQVSGTKEPTCEGREVLLGPRAGDFYLVQNGLFDGELVVMHGNFKIDSACRSESNQPIRESSICFAEGECLG